MGRRAMLGRNRGCRHRFQWAVRLTVEQLEQRTMLAIAAPTGLIASGSPTPGGAQYIALNWKDQSNNEDGFKIERKTGSAGTWSQIDIVDANTIVYNDSSVETGVEYSYRLRATNSSEDSSYSNEAPAVEWTSANIGSATGGSWTVDANEVGTLVSNGNGMAGGVDNCRFAYRTLNGDGTIIARVTSVQWTNPMARAAVMIRNSLASNSRGAFLAIMPNGSAQWSFRRTDGSSAQQNNISNQAAPRYVKLARFGSMITASVSADGQAWTQVGQANISMSENVYVGLALSASEYYGGYNTSTFDNISVTNQGHPLPTGWGDRDIGAAPIHEPTTDTATIALAANTHYNLRIESFQNHGSADIHFYWTPPGGSTGQIVPAANLFSTGNTSPAPTAPGGLLAEAQINPLAIQLSWDDSDHESLYQIYRSTDGVHLLGVLV